MTEILLRPATPTDYDAIAAIWHMSASLPGVGPAAMPTLDRLRARVDVEIEAGWQVTVALAGAELIGFLAIKPAAGVLDQLFMHPEARGMGLGLVLLDAAKAQMPGGFALFTRTGNMPARRFYEKHGLMHLRDELHPIFGDPIAYYEWKPA
ncbi:GNAT family N-acetyltransferase [Devosia sp. ZB163]|uniref:GNAT family N-acetyltransferase n=1 Tax=Devosia sp. ZB163 TaxID=3025938 RepID=UPI002360341B|nr:GNAT family N-acetyltransferase [Devosia sp. ZB163]MDC9825180.1 GNAT family N-acetyltransferase [Devosia sp. ZB163]